MEPSPTDWNAIREHILPRLQSPGLPGAVLDIVPGKLSVALSADTEAGVRDVDDADLARWRTTGNGLLAVALNNLRQRSGLEAWYPLHATPAIRVYLDTDGFAASRLLLLDELLEISPFGGILAAVPTNDQLFALPIEQLDDIASIQELVQSTRMAHAVSAAPLSDALFWYDGVHWVHVPVHHGPDALEIVPPEGFLERVRKLASLALVSHIGEA